MNARAQLVRRIVHDCIYKCRLALANTGEGSARHVDACTKELIEYVAEVVCDALGIEYEGPPDIPRRKSDGRPAPWAGKSQVKAHKGG